ncbi:MAG: hypothetical protein QXO12_01655 [Candidatus Pacearchaeota archaeon]
MKKAIEISFGFIFSLIIVAITVFVAVWAIKQFIDIRDRTAIQAGIKDIENTIKDMFFVTEARETKSFYFPSAVEYICFINYSSMNNLNQYIRSELNKYGSSLLNKNNLFIIPYKTKLKYKVQGSYLIKCGEVNCLKLINSICFKNINNKVKITFKKDAEGIYIE